MTEDASPEINFSKVWAEQEKLFWLGFKWFIIGALFGAFLHWAIENESHTAIADKYGHPIIWIPGRYERVDSK